MKILVEVTELMSEAEIRSELAHVTLDMGHTLLGTLSVKVVGEVLEVRQSDGYGGIRRSYHLEEL